jgi:membrane-bound acyltransferase YfiQ involved in biofilm formation
MLKKAGIASLSLAVLFALSGIIFVNSYDLSDSEISVIEASIMQISHLRYLIAAILAATSTICFSAHAIVGALNAGKLHDAKQDAL